MKTGLIVLAASKSSRTMAVTDAETKSVKLPAFDGTHDGYQKWWMRFKAYARVHKWVQALAPGTGDPDLPATEAAVLDADIEVAAAQTLAKKRNDIAMAQFTMAFTTESEIRMVFAAETSNWPNGKASLVVDALNKKYCPQDTASLVELQQELYNVTMKKNDDPSVLFGKLSAISNKYNRVATRVSPEQLFAVAVSAAPGAYQGVITSELRLKGAAVTIEDIESAMYQYYRSTRRTTKSSRGDDDEELMLSAFDGNCFKCGKKGHKSNECRARGATNGAAGRVAPRAASRSGGRTGGGRSNNNQGRFNGNCNTCGKPGHKAATCWENDANAHLRPSNWTSKRGKSSEVTAVAVNNMEFLLGAIDGIATEEGQFGMSCDVEADTKTIGGTKEEQVGFELGLAGLTFPASRALLTDPNVFIADTGSTVHSTRFKHGFKNSKRGTDDDAITMGNGTREDATMIGDLQGTMCNNKGNELGVATLTDVAYLPTSKFNLFSVTKLQREGWILHGDTKQIKLTKGNNSVVFDIIIDTPKGAIFAMYLKRNTELASAAADGTTEVRVVGADGLTQVRGIEPAQLTMTIKQAHERFGHANEAATRRAAEHMGIKIARGTLKVCEACARAKAKQKNVIKHNVTHQQALSFPKRVFLDIATLKSKEGQPPVTKPNWLIIVDEATNMKFSFFFATKNGMVEPTCELFHKWKQQGHVVQIVRMDNAGENRKLQARCCSVDWKLNMEFEFTARDTPQQNHLAELGFAVLANKTRTLMTAANIPFDKRFKLWKEAVKTATLLDGLLVVEMNGVFKTRFEHAFGSNPKFAKHLRTWGEAGTVKTKITATSKVSDRGVQCMFIGYALDHDGDCYRMWNPVTDGVHVSRDIIWLRRMFYNPIEAGIIGEPLLIEGADNEGVVVEAWEGDNLHPNTDLDPSSNDAEVDDDAETNTIDNRTVFLDDLDGFQRTTRSGRMIRNPARLIEEIGAVAAEGAIAADNYEIKLSNAEVNYYYTMAELGQHPGEMACVGMGVGGGFDTTHELHVMKYDEAMATEDKDGWEDSVNSEHDRMVKRKVWRAIPPTEAPEDAKIIDSTWAMKKKAMGLLRARVTARGFMQIPGVHYDPKTIAAPVTNEMTIRIILTLMIMAIWIGELLDVKGAFLHGDFGPKEAPILMKIPQGFEKFYPKGWLLLLLKTIYGLKQAAFAFWKALLKAFKAMNFERSKADPCLYYAWTKYGLVTWISWVDDCLVCGSPEGVKIAKAQMMNQFDCDEIGNMDEYVGCKVDRDHENGLIKFTQPVMLQSFIDEFDLPETKKQPNTPAAPGEFLVKGDETTNLDEELQAKYRSGVGKLLHMMRWSRPDILNAVRELSRYMTGATPAHMKAMLRVMKYCVGSPERGWTLKPTRKWDGSAKHMFIISGLSDSDYAKDIDTRRSVSGTAVFLEGSCIGARSSTQKTVALSVTEAELSAATQCAQDMLFAMRVVESLGLKVQKPMILEVDNKGAHDLAHNWTIGGRVRHVDVRINFLRELKEDGILELEWIPGEENASDLFTKNLPGPAFMKHAPKFVGEIAKDGSDDANDNYAKSGDPQYDGRMIDERMEDEGLGYHGFYMDPGTDWSQPKFSKRQEVRRRQAEKRKGGAIRKESFNNENCGTGG